MAEPASIRYKNPGAMWGSPLAIKWGAQKKAVTLNDGKGQGNNIAVFSTYIDGICAQLDLWRTSKHYRNKKFSDAIAIWSGHNEVESYIAFVLKRVPGMTRNTVLNDAFWQSDDGIAFLKAQAWHEAGKRYPAPEADWLEAQRIVFEKPPAKTGTLAALIPNKGQVIAGARAVGGVVVGGGTLAVQATTSVTETPGVTIESAKPIIDKTGEVVGQIKTVVEWVPEGVFAKITKFVASPGFLAFALAIVLVAWAVSYYLRRNEGPK